LSPYCHPSESTNQFSNILLFSSEISKAGEEKLVGFTVFELELLLSEAERRRFAGGEGRELKIEFPVVGEGGVSTVVVVVSEEDKAGETGKVTVGIDSLKTFHSGSNHLQEVIFFKRQWGS